MKRCTTATAPFIAAAGVVVLALAATECAEDLDARPAASPEPIGYTPPAERAGGAALAPSQGAATQPMGSALAAPQWAGDIPAPDAYADTDPAALSDFRTPLEPYGTWTDDPTYGTVWVPASSAVGDGFTPYVTGGHWEYGDDYVWASDYSWGWAPFHYGRWVYSAPGWAWIPGRAYAGAWVSWRYGGLEGGYVGWAPLAPTWCWRGGVAVGTGFVPREPYAFVGSRDLFAPKVSSRVVAGPQVGVIAAQTRPWIAAKPTVGPAPPGAAVSGPPPAAINLAPSQVVRISSATTGLAQARAYARPSTATEIGASRPFASASANVGPARSFHPSGIGGRVGGVAPFAPAGGTPGPSPHFGGRFGGGFVGSSAGARPALGARSPVPAYALGSASGSAGSRSGPAGVGGAPRSAPALMPQRSFAVASAPAQAMPPAAPVQAAPAAAGAAFAHAGGSPGANAGASHASSFGGGARGGGGGHGGGRR